MLYLSLFSAQVPNIFRTSDLILYMTVKLTMTRLIKSYWMLPNSTPIVDSLGESAALNTVAYKHWLSSRHAHEDPTKDPFIRKILTVTLVWPIWWKASKWFIQIMQWRDCIDGVRDINEDYQSERHMKRQKTQVIYRMK